MANKLGFDIGFKLQNLNTLKQASKSFTTLGRNARQVSTGFAGFQKKIQKVNNSLNNMSKDSNRASDSLKHMNKSLKLPSGVVSIATMYMLSNAIGNVINASMDMIETNNLFVVSVGNAIDSANEYVESLHKISGLDITNVKNSVGTFSLLGRSMGINEENSAKLATNMSNLALDLSSLTNVPINQVMKDLRSGLVGQSETVYKYGLDVTEASLKQEAMAQGITKTVRNMGQGEKMALRYSVMIKRSGLAHGDFAKTIEQPANQIRILSMRFVTLTRSIGSIFIPMLERVLPYLNAVVQVLIEIADKISVLFGYETAKPGKAMGNLGDSAKDTADSLNDAKNAMKALSGMDELNVLTPPSQSTATGVTVGDPNQMNFEGYNNFLDMVHQKSDDIAIIIKDNLALVVQYFNEVTQPVQESIGRLLDSFSNIGADLDGLGTKMYEFAKNKGLPTFFELVAVAIDMFRIALEKAIEIIKWVANVLDPANKKFALLREIVLTVTGVFGGFVLGMLVVVNIIKTVMNVVNAVTTIIGLLTSPIGLVVLAIVAVVSAIILVHKHWDEISVWFINKWNWVSDKIGTAVQKIKDTVKSMYEKIKYYIELISAPINFLIGYTIVALTRSFLKLKTSVVKVFNGIKSKVMEVIEYLNTKIESFIGVIQRAINSVKTFFTKKSEYDDASDVGNYGANMSSFIFPKLASGGSLEKGSIFQAGEAGAELIGSYNNKTTVMPLENSGFVEAISKAVYEAVSSANQTGGQIIENVLNLDGNVIYKNQQQVAQKRGSNSNLGVFSR